MLHSFEHNEISTNEKATCASLMSLDRVLTRATIIRYGKGGQKVRFLSFQSLIYLSALDEKVIYTTVLDVIGSVVSQDTFGF